MTALNELYKCRSCYGMTPRDLKYCHWCDTRLPDYELKAKARDNNPHPDEQEARMLPKTYKKFGE